MRIIRIGITTVCLAFLIGLAGCEQDGPAENAGEKIDEAVEETGDEMEEAADEMEEDMEGDGSGG